MEDVMMTWKDEGVKGNWVEYNWKKIVLLRGYTDHFKEMCILLLYPTIQVVNINCELTGSVDKTYLEI